MVGAGVGSVVVGGAGTAETGVVTAVERVVRGAWGVDGAEGTNAVPSARAALRNLLFQTREALSASPY